MNTLSNIILIKCVQYLGPAAEVFLKRQTAAHMKGLDFERITAKDVPTLMRWILISGRLIIKDKADELVRELETELKMQAER